MRVSVLTAIPKGKTTSPSPSKLELVRVVLRLVADYVDGIAVLATFQMVMLHELVPVFFLLGRNNAASLTQRTGAFHGI